MRPNLTSQPMTYRDAFALLVMSRGGDVTAAFEKPQSTDGARQGKAVPVSVHGGASTSHARKVADQWHTANMSKDWAKSTGSDPAAIAWLMSGD